MENVCRLCANVKSNRQLVCSIEDERFNIVQKLIDCCRWNSIGGDEFSNLPQKICNTCFRQLLRSWEFAEQVEAAQKQLLDQFIEIKPKIHFQSCDIQDEFQNDWKTSEDSIIEHENYIPALKIKDEPIEDSEQIDDLKPTMADVASKVLNENVPNLFSYRCEICGKNLSSKSNLQSHQKLHLPRARKKHYQCYICKTTFSYKKSIIHHMPSHWGGKVMNECNVCKMNFSRSDALRRHSLIHLGKQPHTCSQCGKGFRTKFNLKTHERHMHTGERPYLCQYCGYQSASGPNLRKHVQQRHKNEWKQILDQANNIIK